MSRRKCPLGVAGVSLMGRLFFTAKNRRPVPCSTKLLASSASIALKIGG